MSIITINTRWCKSCGICVDFCPTHALGYDEKGNPVVANEAVCTRCKLCELRCPDLAIEIGGEK